MRNLKKVMALALATVMLLGIMVMGAGAADYTAYKDAASVDAKYELAVEMLKEIGVFEGDNNGNLNAKNTLTRGEAAKVIATLKLTKATASKIGAPIAAPFADVATSDWYAPFVAYCKDLGIISGVGDNKFDPAGTLTGYAFAKMLLVVLGYKADAEGYTGASWDTNVNLGALQAKLLTGLNINLADAITREQAIQMAYNALLADMVYYTGGGTSIVLPDGTTINSSTGTRYPQGQTLMASLYGTTYTPDTNVDAINLPTTTWVKAGKIVAEAPAYTVVKTYTGDIAAVKASAIYADAGLTATTVVNVAVNTFDNVVTTAQLTKKDAATPVKPAANYNGGTMKLIKVGTTYSLLIEYNTLTAVTKVNKATADTKANVELANGLKIETEAYAKGDLLSITTGTKDGATVVLTHKKATIISGKVTETTKTQVVINGEKYAIGGLNGAIGVEAAPALAGYAIDNTTVYDLVVENGFIVGKTKVAGNNVTASLEKVYYVAAFTEKSTDVWGAATKYAQVVAMADGTVTLVKVDPEADQSAKIGTLVTLKDVKVNGAVVYQALEAFTGISVTWEGGVKVEKQTIFQSTLAETDKALKTTDKAIETVDGKAYLTAGTMILNITGTGNELKGTYVAAPFDVALSDAQAAAKVVYTKNKDNVAEAGVIIIVGKINANKVESTVDYYVLAGNTGSVWNAEAKAVNYKRSAIDMKTFEKIDILTANADFVGFAKATFEKGAYKFESKVPTTVVEVTSGATLYGTYLTAGGKVDAESADAKVVNYVNAKTADGVVISTVAELVKAGKPFYMNVTDKNVVTYIIIK